MWVLVQDSNLFFPVELIPPIGNYLLEVGGIEAILKAAIFQRICVAGSVNTFMKVLQKIYMCMMSHSFIIIIFIIMKLIKQNKSKLIHTLISSSEVCTSNE